MATEGQGISSSPTRCQTRFSTYTSHWIKSSACYLFMTYFFSTHKKMFLCSIFKIKSVRAASLLKRELWVMIAAGLGSVHGTVFKTSGPKPCRSILEGLDLKPFWTGKSSDRGFLVTSREDATSLQGCPFHLSLTNVSSKRNKRHFFLGCSTVSAALICIS